MITATGDPTQPIQWKWPKDQPTKKNREEWSTILGIITKTGFSLTVKMGEWIHPPHME